MSQTRNADGLAVKRVQTALTELGFPVGPKGADGFFGPDTGNAVVKYKASKGLVPGDPVVGPGTSGALDDDFAVTAPQRDPDLGDFTEFVRAGRLEPFAAAELTQMQQAPLISWRHMLALFTLDALQRDRLVGVAALSRLEDLKPHFLTIAADPQVGVPASAFFDAKVASVRADDLRTKREFGRTMTFDDRQGVANSFVSIQDNVLLGRAFSTLPGTSRKRPVLPHDTLSHELTHARNVVQSATDQLINDSDAGAFADTALAAQRTATTGTPTAHELSNFIEEMAARHVGWIIERERAGDPDAPKRLSTGALAAAAHFYITPPIVSLVISRNGYIEILGARGEADRFSQLALWLELAAKPLLDPSGAVRARRFSDDDAENDRTRQLFSDTAAFCNLRARDPLTAIGAAPPLPAPDGLLPLDKDFT